MEHPASLKVCRLLSVAQQKGQRGARTRRTRWEVLRIARVLGELDDVLENAGSDPPANEGAVILVSPHQIGDHSAIGTTEACDRPGVRRGTDGEASLLLPALHEPGVYGASPAVVPEEIGGAIGVEIEDGGNPPCVGRLG